MSPTGQGVAKEAIVSNTTLMSDLYTKTPTSTDGNIERILHDSVGNANSANGTNTKDTSSSATKSNNDTEEPNSTDFKMMTIGSAIKVNLTNRQRRSTGRESLSERTVCPWRSITSSFTDHVPNIVREVECVSTEPTVSGTTLTYETIYEYKRLERRSCQMGNNETCHQIVKVAVGWVTTLLCLRGI